MKIGLLCGREQSFPPAFLARVTELGRHHGITAEMVTLGANRMDEIPPYRVIVDRISNEVEYYRAALKHAALQGTYVINNPFWWTADDKFFGYSLAWRLGLSVPKTILLPQKAYPTDVDILPGSLHNLQFPLDWDAILDYVGRPATLKPYAGAGQRHVYTVSTREELLAAYDRTAPYCMMLQEQIPFDQYVRCFVFGKTDIVPVQYDPDRRQYHVNHQYLSPPIGARVVKDAETVTQALGYDVNVIEFAVKDGVPFAVDLLNPAPDLERDRITPFYFDLVVERLARLVIDRALTGTAEMSFPRWETQVGLSPTDGVVGGAAHR